MPVLPGKCQYSQKNTSVAREMPGLIVNSVNHQCCQEKMPVLPEKHQCCQRNASVARETSMLPENYQCCQKNTSVATETPILPVHCKLGCHPGAFSSHSTGHPNAAHRQEISKHCSTVWLGFSYRQEVSKHCGTVWLVFSSQTENFKAL